MKKVSLFLFFCIFILKLHSQESFLIYSLKGKIVIQEDNATSEAKIGRLLPVHARITLSSNAALTLICNQKSMITINKAGTYNLTDYKDQCNVATASVSGNYLKYVWTQLTQKPGTPEKNRKLFMNNTGAVSRNVNNVWIDPRLDTTNYIAGHFPLSWKSYAEAEDFQFMLFDEPQSQTSLISHTTKDHFIDIQDIAPQLQAGKRYYWTAAIKGQQNEERKVLQIWDKESFQKLLKEWTGTETAFEQEAAKNFRLAFLLEQAHFLAESYKHYQKAASLQPGMELYTATLKAFKKDYGIE